MITTTSTHPGVVVIASYAVFGTRLVVGLRHEGNTSRRHGSASSTGSNPRIAFCEPVTNRTAASVESPTISTRDGGRTLTGTGSGDATGVPLK